MPHIESLASELIAHIFDSLCTVQDAVSLSATCHRMHAIYTSSQHMRFLTNSAERQYGPLSDATQLLTHNASQPPHIMRNVNMSMPLLKQIVEVGSIANKWADIYPFKKWKDNYVDRRLLTETERHRVRRAVYRIWLYSSAFHSPNHSRETRLLPHRVAQREDLLRNWTTDELAELADMRSILRDTLSANVAPSNGTISRKFRARHGDEAVNQLVFNMTSIHLNFPPPSDSCLPPNATDGHYAAAPPSGLFHDSNTYVTTRTKAYHLGRCAGYDAATEGWGDSLGHWYVVEDLMKLDPARILWLKEKKLRRTEVLSWVRGMGEWFENNGETFGETLEGVLEERGVESEDLGAGGIVGDGVDWDED